MKTLIKNAQIVNENQIFKGDLLIENDLILKIGNDIYITRGESKYVVRSSDYPSKCTLSVNGTFFLDKNGQPFSLILATSDLQD